MTKIGDSLHNASAERMNNTLKNGWIFNDGDLNFEQASRDIEKFIDMYNRVKPHSSMNENSDGNTNRNKFSHKKMNCRFS